MRWGKKNLSKKVKYTKDYDLGKILKLNDLFMDMEILAIFDLNMHHNKLPTTHNIKEFILKP